MNFQQLFNKKSIDLILLDSKVEDAGHPGLSKNLRLIDLTALAIAAIVGAGIFSTIGNASAYGGPAVSLLFVFTAVACGFSALCYADFASRIPLSGSAYTYAYASLGELLAWIIGWDLLMEYSIGNIAVAISWSEYFTSFLHGFGISIPQYLTMDYLSAARGFKEATKLIGTGVDPAGFPLNIGHAYAAWTQAPAIGGVRIIANIPAFGVVVFITTVVYIGIRESKIAGNIMVFLKVFIVLMVIVIGAFYINRENWHPFAPNGVNGVLRGVSAVFFAYIGFDAISTTAEECKNPQRDLPRAMILSLLISTVLYVMVTLVLTGVVNYKYLAVGDPLAFIFQKLKLDWLAGIVAFGAIIAMASVLLVFQVGQPRIWMSMSRDGLLPPRFAKIHPRFKTPAFSTIITGLLVSLPSLFTNLTEMTDLTSIGTLFAFVLVCAGVLVLDTKGKKSSGKFSIPYINSRYLMPIIVIVLIFILIQFNREGLRNFLSFPSGQATSTFEKTILDKIPQFLFLLVALGVTILSIVKKMSLIPVLGLLTNLYLMSELGITNWLRFLIWLVIGLVIYFTYSIRHSKLRKRNIE